MFHPVLFLSLSVSCVCFIDSWFLPLMNSARPACFIYSLTFSTLCIQFVYIDNLCIKCICILHRCHYSCGVSTEAKSDFKSDTNNDSWCESIWIHRPSCSRAIYKSSLVIWWWRQRKMCSTVFRCEPRGGAPGERAQRINRVCRSRPRGFRFIKS